MFDPVFLNFFGVDIHWYGLLWVVGYLLARHVATRLGPPLLAASHKAKDARALIDELMFFCLLGAFVGGRLGYAFIYGWSRLAADWLWLFKVTEGGMSFHGGLVGVVVGVAWFARRRQVDVWRIGDIGALAAPVGLACGRLGNFINGELWGHPTDLPWGIVFPTAGDGLARHPSQLYGVAGEGVLLFAGLALLARQRPPPGTIVAAFLVGYGSIRFGLGFLRAPDAHMGYPLAGLTTGQLLSVPMVVAGLGLLAWLRARARLSPPAAGSAPS